MANPLKRKLLRPQDMSIRIGKIFKIGPLVLFSVVEVLKLYIEFVFPELIPKDNLVKENQFLSVNATNKPVNLQRQLMDLMSLKKSYP